MKQILLTISLTFLLFSCGGNPEKDRISDLLKTKIGEKLPFKDLKIGKIENGTAVIVDNHWCYWVDNNNKIYCVNGVSKTIYNSANQPNCEDAPIKATFSEIEKIVK